MPFHLLKNNITTKSTAFLRSALFLLGFNLLAGHQLLAQNLIVNPSFEKYTGNGEPCNSYYGNHDPNVGWLLLELQDFPGWIHSYHANISYKYCYDNYYYSKFKNDSLIHGDHWLVNHNEPITKGGNAYHGLTAGRLNHDYIDIPKTPSDPYWLSFHLGSCHDTITEGNTYYFSVWLSPPYEGLILTRRSGNKSVRLTSYQMSSFVLNLVDSPQNDQLDSNWLPRHNATYFNPRTNIIEGNADSNWVELQFVFTANKTAQHFTFGFISNAYSDNRDDYYSLNPYYQTDTTEASHVSNGMAYYVDAFTLLFYHTRNWAIPCMWPKAIAWC